MKLVSLSDGDVSPATDPEVLHSRTFQNMQDKVTLTLIDISLDEIAHSRKMAHPTEVQL